MATPECTKAREWAALAPDGALSRLEGLALERHLARCPDCRAFADTVRWLAGAIAAEQLEAAPLIRRRLQARMGRRRPARRAVLGAGAVVAACLVAFSGGANGVGEPPSFPSPSLAALYSPGASGDRDRP